MRSLPFAAVLVVLAVPAPALAYLVKRTPGGAPVRWERARVEVTLGDTLEARLPDGHARRAAVIALDAWRGHGGPDLELSTMAEPGPYRASMPGIQVVLLDEWAYAPGLLAVTATSYREADGVIVDADVLVNPASELALLDELAPEPRFDLGAVLAHELGHALGLGETDADPLATMWPRIRRGETHQRTLAADDEEGVAEAYRGAKLAPVGGCGGARVAMGRSGAGAVPWLVVALVLTLALALAWRRRSVEGAASRGRPSAARPAGVAFACALALAGIPELFVWAPSEPVALRAARALAARDLTGRERAARLDEAARDPEASVRVSALNVILGAPRRDDRRIVGMLVSDEDARVSSLACSALAVARVAPPTDVVEADGAVRELFEGARRGEARITSVVRGVDGLVRTRVQVGALALEVPGGCLDGVCTEVGESLAPRDGEELLVAPSGAWARVSGALAYDGWIEGSAVRGLVR